MNRGGTWIWQFCEKAASVDGRWAAEGTAAGEQVWHKSDRQDTIVAIVLRWRWFNRFEVFPPRRFF